ncbi:MAG: hypothetical protein HDT46_01455 [Ruminococcaceae bacterium]|nr:hypothetical protein [Oscillospiraceae bacterium]
MFGIFLVICAMAAIIILFNEKKPKILRLLAYLGSVAGAVVILTAVNAASGFLFTELFGVLAAVFLLAAVAKCAADTIYREPDKSGKNIRKIKREKAVKKKTA